jgi:hypothetical protein
MGAAYHLGLETLAKTGSVDQAMLAAGEGYATLPGWANSPELVDEWLTEREQVVSMVAGHAWRWANDQIEVVAAEQVFDMPLVNPDTGASSTLWRVAGKIDKIVKLPDGRLAVMEHKTVGESIAVESDYWRRLRIDGQISLYMLAARFLGHNVETVLYDCVRKASIEPRKLSKADQAEVVKTNQWYDEPAGLHPSETPERETPRMYGARLRNDMGLRPEFYFARMEIARLDADLDAFRAELWEQGADIRERRRNGRWYRNSNACVGFGRCEYLDLCASGDDCADGRVPDGFERVADLHPELSGEPIP